MWTKNKGPKFNYKLEYYLIKFNCYFESNVTYILTFRQTDKLDLTFKIC